MNTITFIFKITNFTLLVFEFNTVLILYARALIIDLKLKTSLLKFWVNLQKKNIFYSKNYKQKINNFVTNFYAESFGKDVGFHLFQTERIGAEQSGNDEFIAFVIH